MKKNNQMFWFNFRIISVLLIFVFGFIILLIVSFIIKGNWIICGGSTSVAPILTQVNQFYHKHDQNKSDFLYNALGSNAASTGIQLNTYSIGFESKNVAFSKNYLRFEIAKDYVIVLFHLPNNLHFVNSQDQIKANPDLKYGLEIKQKNSQLNILKTIYEKQTTWKTFFNNSNVESKVVSPTSSKIKGSLNKKIATYTREAGSGTRSYFETSVLKGNSNHASVATSNGAMLNSIENTPSSVGFLSFSYIKKIRDDIINKHLNLAILATTFTNSNKFVLPFVDGEHFSTSNKIDFNKNYQFNRPFVGLLSKKIIDEKKKFLLCLRYVFALLYTPTKKQIEDLKNPYGEVDRIITNLGFQKLGFSDQNQNCDFNSLKEMFQKNNININQEPNWLK